MLWYMYPKRIVRVSDSSKMVIADILVKVYSNSLIVIFPFSSTSMDEDRSEDLSEEEVDELIKRIRHDVLINRIRVSVFKVGEGLLT